MLGGVNWFGKIQEQTPQRHALQLVKSYTKRQVKIEGIQRGVFQGTRAVALA
jgi:hypothetical protein